MKNLLGRVVCIRCISRADDGCSGGRFIGYIVCDVFEADGCLWLVPLGLRRSNRLSKSKIEVLQDSVWTYCVEDGGKRICDQGWYRQIYGCCEEREQEARRARMVPRRS